MQPLLEPLGQVRDFVDSGGYVLWAILFVSVVLWTLIIERYLYLRLGHRACLRRTVDQWRSRRDRSSWYAMQIRRSLIAQLSARLTASLRLIGTLIALCPLLGVLGTVTGMIQVFDVIAVLGTSNARAMAAGISMATTPTMAGMVVAISGIFFSVHLQQRAATEIQKAADLLVRSEDTLR
jgi:biopolymer transport protein ExbB